MATVCPNCDSEAVAWAGGYQICQKCKKWHHHKPCFFCGHNELLLVPSWANCGDCGWTGDPYDLIELEEEDKA